MGFSIYKRSKDSWTVTLSLGYEIDPTTGKKKRKQKVFTVKGTKEQARKKAVELESAHNRGDYIEPSNITVSEWLDEWIKTVANNGRRRERTIATYTAILKNHVKPALGSVKLQKLQPNHIQAYYNNLKLSAATKEMHHTIIHSALEAARKLGYINRNAASLVPDKPRKPDAPEDVVQNCWTAEEARKFLAAAQEAGPQAYAFYTLALQTGMRKGELCGLKWTDMDFGAGTITVSRTLLKVGSPPKLGPPKNGQARSIKLAAAVLQVMKKHKLHQDQLKMKERPSYHDFGLIFAKEWDELGNHTASLGDPLPLNNIGQREFKKLITAAGVKKITFHGMRHTCATLALQGGTQPHVVQKLLGHKGIDITLEIYGHVLPDMKEEVAEKLSSLLGTK